MNIPRVALALLFAAGATACVRTATVTTGQLPLRRVVVYRNGVGYFERAGHIDESEVRFRMRQHTIGDFLATLAIVEKGGSSVRSASFPVEVEDETEPPAPAPPCAPNMPEQMCWLEMLRRPVPPAPKPKPKNPLRNVVLRLDGKEHDLAVGYVAETPLWRPSYRVVVGQGGNAELQAWGIVQNLSGEDWRNVQLVLVAGAPLAFQSTLGEPITPDRPVVTDQGEVIAAVPEGVTSIEQAPAKPVDRYDPEAPPAPQAEEMLDEEDADEAAASKEAAPVRAEKKRLSLGSGAGAGAPRPKSMKAPVVQAPAPVMSAEAPPSPPRNVSALAAVTTGSGTTRYALPYPVTVPDESATMVLLASHSVPGESVFLFAPDPGVPDSMAHPFRVARFKNATSGLLERGPIAVFERGSFLGQGMLESLPPGGTATVPFALERGLGIQRDVRHDQRGARLFKIAEGELTIERDHVTRTTYAIHNGTAETAKVMVRHPRRPGTRLFRPPAGTEDNATGSAMVPMQVQPKGKAELIVDERQPMEMTVDWLSPPASEAVRAYLADPRADPNIVPKLQLAWQLREAWRKLSDEQQTLQAEQGELERHANQLRESLDAIRKNAQAADLRVKLNEKLEQVLDRLAQITKRMVELTLQLREQEVRFRDSILDIKLLSVPPPKD